MILRNVHPGAQSRMTGKNQVQMAGKAESKVTRRDSHRTIGNQSPLSAGGPGESLGPPIPV